MALQPYSENFEISVTYLANFLFQSLSEVLNWQTNIHVVFMAYCESLLSFNWGCNEVENIHEDQVLSNITKLTVLMNKP